MTDRHNCAAAEGSDGEAVTGVDTRYQLTGVVRAVAPKAVYVGLKVTDLGLDPMEIASEVIRVKVPIHELEWAQPGKPIELAEGLLEVGQQVRAACLQHTVPGRVSHLRFLGPELLNNVLQPSARAGMGASWDQR